VELVTDLVLIAEDLGFSPHGDSEDLAKHRFLQGVGLGEGLVERG
jgi:hypothetical protein